MNYFCKLQWKWIAHTCSDASVGSRPWQHWASKLQPQPGVLPMLHLEGFQSRPPEVSVVRPGSSSPMDDWIICYSANSLNCGCWKIEKTKVPETKYFRIHHFQEIASPAQHSSKSVLLPIRRRQNFGYTIEGWQHFQSQFLLTFLEMWRGYHEICGFNDFEKSCSSRSLRFRKFLIRTKGVSFF